MRRDQLDFLKNWRKDPIRVPLLIRGARQVGKSWLVNLFGKEFSSYECSRVLGLLLRQNRCNDLIHLLLHEFLLLFRLLIFPGLLRLFFYPTSILMRFNN